MTLLLLLHRTVSAPRVIAAELLTTATSVAVFSLMLHAFQEREASIPSMTDESGEATLVTITTVAVIAVITATTRSIHDAGRPALLALTTLGTPPAAVAWTYAARSALIATCGAILAGTVVVPALAPVTSHAYVALLGGAEETAHASAGDLVGTVVTTSIAVAGLAFVSALGVAGRASRELPAAAARRIVRRRRASAALRVTTAIASLALLLFPIALFALLPDDRDEMGDMPNSDWVVAFMGASLVAGIICLAALMPLIASATVRAIGWVVPRGGLIWHLARHVALERAGVTAAYSSAIALVVGSVALTQATFDIVQMLAFELSTSIGAEWLNIASTLGPMIAVSLSGGVAAALVASRHDARDWVALAGIGMKPRQARLLPVAQALIQTMAAGGPAVVFAMVMLAGGVGLAQATETPLTLATPDLRPAGAALLLCFTITLAISARRLPDALGRGTGAGGRLLL